MESAGKKQTFKQSLDEINGLLDADEQITEQQLSKMRSDTVQTSGSPRQRAAVTAVLGEDAGAACDWEALCRLECHRSEVKDLVIARRDERILELERAADPRHRHWVANVRGTLIICVVGLVLVTWGLWRPALELAAVRASGGLLRDVWDLAQENAQLKIDYYKLDERLDEIDHDQAEIERRMGVRE